MRRTLIILAVCALAAAAILVAAWLALFETSPGRRFIAARIEAELGDVFGGAARIGALEGRLPGEIILAGVEISDGAAVWLTAGTLRIAWRPAALVSGKISIDEAVVDGVELLRRPGPSPDREPQPEARAAIRLPKGLPNISIRRLRLSNIGVAEAVAGRVLVIDGEGALRAEGDTVMLRLTANSGVRGDVVDAAINLDPDADRGLVDVVVASDADGAISSLLGLGGPAYVEITGDAALSEFEANVFGELGGYGAIDATLAADLVSGESVDIDAALRFGDKLAAMSRALGPTVSLAGEVRQVGAEVTLSLSRISADAGSAAGFAQWSNRGDIIDNARAEFEVEFAPAHFEALQRYFGPRLWLSADAVLSRPGYAVDAQLISPTMTVSLSDGRSDLRSRIAGRIAADLSPNSALPTPFHDGARVNAEITTADNQGIAFEGLDIALPDGSSIAGAGHYGGAGRTVSFAGDISLSPSFITERLAALTPDGPLVARVAASGAIDDFAVEADAESSDVAMNGATIPAAEITARISGLPHAVNAAVSAKPIDGAGNLTLLLKLADAGSIEIPRLQIESPSFSLSGSGAWSAAGEFAAIDLTYFGAAGAQPYPGFTLSGAVTAKGEIGRGARASNLRISGENLASDDFSAGAVDLAAAGPADHIAFTLAAANAFVPAAGLFATIDSGGVADIAAAPSILIERLAAQRAGPAIALTAPTRVVFNDGVRIENLRAAYGAEGALALDGVFSPRRWRASIVARDLPLPEAESVVSFDIALDTDRAEPGRGEFSARSLFAAAEANEINGRLTWNGARLRLANKAADDALTFSVDAPLVLTRSPKLAVKTEGALAGDAAYTGRLQGLALYLPLTLRTLEGDIEAHARLSGTLKQPAIDGRVVIRDGAYTEPVSGLTLTGLHLDADAISGADGSAIDFSAGARGPGQDAETLKLAGRINLAGAASIDATLTLDEAAFAAGPVNRAIASGEVRLAGPLASMTAQGALALDELDAEIVEPPSGGLVAIDVVAQDGAATAPLPAKITSRPPPLNLDIAIAADDRVFIRGRGLDSEWRANIRALGPAQSAVLVGNLSLRRGTLDFSGRRFTFSRGEIAFDRLSANDPSFDLRAEYVTRDGVTAAIEVGGRASAPSVSLVSSPSLPPEDIMALVLFGKPARDLSALESLQVAQALAQLSGVGPFGKGGVTGIARRMLGLDLLNIAVDADAGASSLEVGKYVAEGLFVSAKQDARGENGSVRVEYEITDSISIETEMRQDGEQTVSANWKHDF